MSTYIRRASSKLKELCVILFCCFLVGTVCQLTTNTLEFDFCSKQLFVSKILNGLNFDHFLKNFHITLKTTLFKKSVYIVHHRAFRRPHQLCNLVKLLFFMCFIRDWPDKQLENFAMAQIYCPAKVSILMLRKLEFL